jgi:inhibitor of KinA sporulation pathway (predicted exonuclease)
MTKETFYFRHDYNARGDRKLVNVIMKHGMIGIGIYWCIVEMLYEEGGYLPFEYERISFELRTEEWLIKSVINDFELFVVGENNFYSESVLDRLQERCDKSDKARASINKRWNKLKKNTNVIRPRDSRNTIEEKIVKDSIEEKKIKYLDSVFLTEEQYKKLILKYGTQKTIKAIEVLNNAIMSKGYKYKSHYHTIIGWPMKEVEGGKDGNRQTANPNRGSIRGDRQLTPDAEEEADRITRKYYADKAAADGKGKKDT